MTLAGSDVSTARARRDLLNLACEVEGHPDNVAPAIFGGFQIALSDERMDHELGEHSGGDVVLSFYSGFSQFNERNESGAER